MKVEQGAGRPWQHFADYYYAGTPSKRRVDADREWYAKKWGHLTTMGDDAADRLAVAIIDKRVARADFEAALTNGVSDAVDFAPEIVEFIAPRQTLPACLDAEAIARGAKAYRRLPMPAWVAHGAIAGFIFGAISPNSSMTLSLNEAIVESTHKRYVETAKYVHDLLVDPAGSSAFQTGCRVRLVHGFVRTEISRHVQWNTEAYGTPINLAPMLVAAAVEGPWAVPLLEKQGYRLTAQEKDDIAMFSAYQSFLQGVPEEELLTTHDDYSDFLYFYLSSDSVPLPEDRPAAEKVLRPLIANGYPISSSQAVTDLFNAFILAETRRSFGPEISREWGIDVPAAGLVVAPIAGVLNRALGFARRMPLTRPLCDKLADNMVYSTMPQMVKRVTGSSDVKFDSAAKEERTPVGGAV
ncbi:oxygenase MpaB family protein [Mycolicibacterium confluentis]|uniref:ER-bound oxygenase mpaB/mpaB'/Rubber oxygenase catalytic domain-containing protein n=1 Tax=Mycolicibacterium confluentis TaxID=28047 RepID=A0A7I7XX84_9MYCO|nr:oxygenase MpaB family protein [Mycolicibacterium confluentis]MCV7321828.1 DUF2236 domain-containing protein [Mycolicibacterium confluentis]ORV32086.1 hypothetical protein AWB99_10520 [Mycolicibacterium confluentis]BBZ33641.1 hypothetical protein MCNF_22460 [Mycolicibacterium confluentis]